MKEVTLKINGKDIKCKEGMTILEAAKTDPEINIPTLCYSDKLQPRGSCRLCMVEITKGKRKKLVASCVYPVEEGLVVETNTEKVIKIRKMLIELLWPSTQHFAEEYGIESSRFALGQDDCNLCGLCVRYCAEIKKKNVVYFKGRGINRKIAFVPGRIKECISCEECFSLCSGGFIMNEMVKLGH